MNRRRKIVFGISASILIVFILLLAAILIAPKLVDTKTVIAKVRNDIKEASGVDIDFEHLVLDFFPHPQISFDQITLSIPRVVRAKAVSMTVHPKILPLFIGKMQIAGLRIDSAEFDYTLPIKPAAEKTTPQPFSYSNLAKRIQAVAATLPEFKIPNLDFQVINSKVNLFAGTQKLIEFSEVNSHLEGPLAGRKIAIRCKSNLWQRISIDGLLNTITYKGGGQIQLTQLDPTAWQPIYFPMRLSGLPMPLQT